MREIEVEDILFERASAAGESDIELASAELVELEGMSVVQSLENGNFSDASGWSAEGGNLTITGGVASFALDPPTLGGGIDSEADYATELGSSVELTGYDNGMQTCEASQPGIVEITELMSGDGWSLEGIALGTVTVTIWEDIDEVDSFTVEVVEASSGGPAETKVERAMSFVAGHKYYLEGEIKSPAAAPGVVIFADDGGALTHNVNSGSSGDWQRVSGIVTASATAEGKIGFKDLREVSATITQTGPLYPVGIIPETFARYIRAFSASASGNYRFIYNNGWKLNGTGAFVNFSYYGISADFNTGNESLRAGSTITVNFSYPYARIAAATLNTTGTIKIQNLAVIPSEFAGSLGRYAASGSYVFTYVSGTGWTFDGGTASVQLAAYGITGTVMGTPSPGAKITINLTITEEVIRMRRLAAYDLTQLGLESVSVADMERIIGGVYHGKGQTNAVAGGISSAGTAQNALDSGVTFTQNYELCRLPDGVSDTLDLAGGKLYRRITLKNVTGSSGAAVTLDGAKSGTAYLSAGGNIGSVVGTTLTLSKSVSGMSVYYELDSPQVTNISEPARYRVATGGVERILRYDCAAGEYVKAALGLRSKIKYRPDYPRQIESDRKKILALFSALGLASSPDPSVIEDASKIAAAL